MDRKKAPHKLQVEDSKQDDNSVVELTQAKMDELKIFRGDAVILKGKNQPMNFLLAGIGTQTLSAIHQCLCGSLTLWTNPNSDEIFRLMS